MHPKLDLPHGMRITDWFLFGESGRAQTEAVLARVADPRGCDYRDKDSPDWLIVQSPFRAKHHVVVQYMAGWMKYPLPLPLP